MQVIPLVTILMGIVRWRGTVEYIYGQLLLLPLNQGILQLNIGKNFSPTSNIVCACSFVQLLTRHDMSVSLDITED
jgi:hypothetical protein